MPRHTVLRAAEAKEEGMKYDHVNKRFTLSTGLSVHGSGRGPFALSFRLLGLDSFIFDTERPLTINERAEIGVYMIEAWQRWIETGSPALPKPPPPAHEVVKTAFMGGAHVVEERHGPSVFASDIANQHGHDPATCENCRMGWGHPSDAK